MNQTEDLLARVAAMLDIQQLAYRYALAFDSRDLERLHGLWYEDVPRLPYPDINIHTVREDFDQWLYGLGPSVLTVANHVINVPEDFPSFQALRARLDATDGSAGA